MKTLKVKLSFGEVELTQEDIKVLKLVVDQAFDNIDDTIYKKLKGLKSKELVEELRGLSDEDLLYVAKLNDQNPIRGYVQGAFTKKIQSEIFVRNGLGKVSGYHLSVKQINFLESLGLNNK